MRILFLLGFLKVKTSLLEKIRLVETVLLMQCFESLTDFEENVLRISFNPFHPDFKTDFFHILQILSVIFQFF